MPSIFPCLLLLFLTTEATACPICHSDLGVQLRAGIFTPTFGWTLLRVLAPFPCLLWATHALVRRLYPALPSTHR